jgi:pimeloyl-ACP methyl ester carboxylesterase
MLSAACQRSAAPPPVPQISAPSSLTDSFTPTPTPTPSGVPDPSTDPAYSKFYDQTLAWTACAGGMQCAWVTVPRDWTNPGGATIALAVNRKPAAGPGKRLGSLFTNPGGPGGSGVEFVQLAWSKIPAQVREHYDVVGFDPRGIGSSKPAIHCLTDSQLDTFLATDPDPTTPSQISEVQDEDQRFADACKKNGPLLANMGTPSVARDLDVMRAAVGDSQLHYLGYSYGTYIGAIYAGLYPTRVGRMVLDGVIDPALTTAAISLGQAQGFELAYSSFVKNCLSGTCPLGSSATQVTDRVAKLLAAVEVHPLPTGVRDRKLNVALATTAILAAMYSQKSWADLRSAVAAAEAGDGSLLLQLADGYFERVNGHYQNNQNEAIYAVNCLDHPGSDTVEEIKTLLPQLTAASPVFGPFIAWGNLPCTYWPVAPTSEPGPIHAPGTPPIVVFGTTRDPATPYQWAKNLAAELDSGVFLSHDGDGHTTFGDGNTCVDSAVDTYLLTGTPPAKGTMC